MTHENTSGTHSLNFIEQIIEEDIKNDKHGGRVHTRFPPEPNGYIHLGHATSICLNYGLAVKYKGLFNLRFDDTNPESEDIEFVDSIRQDVHWLGVDWENREFYASDYFPQLYDFACQLIRNGKAYVDFSSAETIAEEKGTPTEAGKESQYRNTKPEENLRLFEQMKNGEFEQGTCTLRAKIDMASPNMLLRDPIIYRIKKAHHHQTGADWNIYPMYDYAHPVSDSLEGITHSICTMEFEAHRPLYDWYLRELGIFPSRQIEFARRNFNYTIVSKRNLKRLVNEGYVNGWDDPRMPTVAGLRRRGYTSQAIREFADRIGVARRENVADIGLLEFCVREHLNKIATRVMAVLDPIKVVITNYPEGKTEWLDAENNPENPEAGNRSVPFSRELYIERDDFMENPPKKYFRLSPQKEVRLKHAYIIRCDEVVKNEAGEVVELHCSYYENSKSGSDTSGISVKGTLHWVSAATARTAEVRLYDRLFTQPEPGAQEEDMTTFINPNSLQIVQTFVEPSLQEATLGQAFQFIRKGYFCLDKDSTPDNLVFNLTVNLKDSWKG
ncbi:MAG: glutamine--tRNA ligase/YqeY domain fusion protein [Chitinophagales bacterium]|jgi:glutaminyl-tRNA synthetase|nr:glutamine--tRNA ligase/YqeY domain fusion protein [Chitinophagales bacterium]